VRRWSAPDGDLALPVPEGWRDLGPVAGVLAAFAAPEAERGEPRFAPNANLTTTPGEGAGLDVHAERQAQVLGVLLTDAVLLDEEAAELGGVPALRRLVAYRQGIFELTLEQWLLVAGDRLVALSVTCESLDAPAVAPVAAEMAAGLRVG
jgi:hypothetical protein